MKPFRRNAAAAFTLIEILLVIIIIVTLMAVLIPNLTTSRKEAQINTARIYLSRLAGDLARYELANGMPPSTEQGLKALVAMPASEPRPRRWSQIETTIDLDPWGIEYRYEFPGKRNPKGFDLYSFGPDRQAGTDDDVFPEQQ